MHRAGTSAIAEAKSPAFADLSLEEFAARLASTDPVPGGGSASAVTASLAAGLVSMVAGLSFDRPKYEPYRATLERAREAGDASRRRFLELADADARAYSRLIEARRLPTGTDDEQLRREAAVQEASRAATDVPLQVVRECRDLAIEVEALAGRSNVNASSDLNVAGLLLDAAARGAGANVLVNLPSLEDDSYAGAATLELELRLKEIQQLVFQVREAVSEDRLRDPEART